MLGPRPHPVESSWDHLDRLDLAAAPAGRVTRARLSMGQNGLGQPILLPIMIVKGTEPGPTLGLMAALHGNELNGVRVIQKLVPQLDPARMRGTVLAAPVLNIPGFLLQQREFNDGVDLNRIMPGQADGSMSQVYAHRIVSRLVRPCTALLDLHTASFGRINSLYVRADLEHDQCRWMALAQRPQIVLHSPGADGTLRAAAMALGIPAITVEVGDPQRFQRTMVDLGVEGVLRVMSRLGMIERELPEPGTEPVICARSAWRHTDVGGLLEVAVDLCQTVDPGQLLGRVTNVYGDVLAEYRAVARAIVIGKSTNPVNQTGARIVHLGFFD